MLWLFQGTIVILIIYTITDKNICYFVENSSRYPFHIHTHFKIFQIRMNVYKILVIMEVYALTPLGHLAVDVHLAGLDKHAC